MKLKLWQKLGLLILFTSLLSLGIGIGLTQKQFKQNFIQYRKNTEHQMIRLLSRRLAHRYSQHMNWNFIAGNLELWHLILHRPGPPHINRQEHQAHRPMLIAPPPPSSALLDQDKIKIVGDDIPLNKSELFPISVHNKIVGYLQLPGARQLIDKIDRHFEQQLQRVFIVNFAISLVIASIVSLMIAYYLKRRIEPLKYHAQQLEQGKYNERLTNIHQDELGVLADNLNHLAQTLQKNQHSQRQWIANISHELRTPLAIQKCEIEAVQDGIRKNDSAFLQSLLQESQHIERLINDLHQLSVADLGALNYKKSLIDLNQLVSEVVEIYQGKSSLEIQLSCTQANISLFADRQRLFQLFCNLFENSCRYTDIPGKICLHLEQSSNIIRLIIEDSAPGIKDQHLTHLFETFYRVEQSRSRETGGSGLGLAIAQQIVEAHQGKIFAQTSSLGGLSIICEFPILSSQKSQE